MGSRQTRLQMFGLSSESSEWCENMISIFIEIRFLYINVVLNNYVSSAEAHHHNIRNWSIRMVDMHLLVVQRMEFTNKLTAIDQLVLVLWIHEILWRNKKCRTLPNLVHWRELKVIDEISYFYRKILIINVQVLRILDIIQLMIQAVLIVIMLMQDQICKHQQHRLQW